MMKKTYCIKCTSLMFLQKRAVWDFPRFSFSAFEPFTKNKEIVQKLKETRDLIHIYGKEQDEAYFQHDTVYGDF